MLMRSELRDSKVGPFENKFTNPRMAMAMAGSTAVRRNLANNPLGGTGTTWFYSPGTGGAVSIAYVSTGQAIPEQDYAEVTWTVGSSTGNRAMSCGIAFVTTPGRRYTISTWVKSNAAMVVQMKVDWRDSNNAYLSLVSGPNVTLVPGVWTRISLVNTQMPANAARMAPIINVSAGFDVTAGMTLAGTGLLVEERPALLPFFHGGTVNDRGVAYSWEGAVNGSTSIARAGVSEVRRNLAINPDANPLTNLWQAQVPNGYTIRTTYEAPSDLAAISAAVLNVDTSDGSLAQFRIRVGGSAVNISPLLNGATSVPVSISFDFWASSLLAGKVHALEIPVTGAPGGASTFRNSYSFTPVAGWNRIEIQATLTPQQTVTGIDYFQHPQIVTPYVAVPANTVLFKAARALIEMAPAKLGGYFSGAITPDGNLTPAWTGSADNSASVLYAIRLDGSSGNAQAQLAWLWTSEAIRSYPNTASQDTALRLNGEFNGFQFGMLPTRTYTIMARIRILAAQTNPAGLARRIVTYWFNGTNHTATQSAQAPNAPGLYEVRMVWTVPAAASQSFVRLYDGGAAVDTGKVQFERLSIVEGVYDGPHLDGDMPRCIWRGTPHASASAGYPAAA